MNFIFREKNIDDRLHTVTVKKTMISKIMLAF